MRAATTLTVVWLVFVTLLGVWILKEQIARLEKHEAKIEMLLTNLRATQQTQRAIIEALRMELSPEQFTPMAEWKGVNE